MNRMYSESVNIALTSIIMLCVCAFMRLCVYMQLCFQFVAAADVKIPRMDKEDEHRSNWARLKHPALERLANPPASGTLQSLGLHVGVDDKASALFDSFLLDSSCLSNLAALVHTLCLPSAD